MTTGKRTVRELGGEFWSELAKRLAEEDANFEVKNQIVEIMMGVLARHEGEVIENDEGLRVPPLDQEAQ